MRCTGKLLAGTLVLALLGGMTAPPAVAAEVPAVVSSEASSEVSSEVSKEASAGQTKPTTKELREVMENYILRKYHRAAMREPIPMDCNALQKRPDRSYMEEYALYRWWREQGKWKQALAACDASREKALAYDKRLGLTTESAAPYLTDRGELLFLLGREDEADAAFLSAAKHLKEDPDRVLDAPYLTDEDRQRLRDARQLRLDELDAYHAQIAAIREAEHPGS